MHANSPTSEQTPCMYVKGVLEKMCFVNYPKVTVPCNINHTSTEIATVVHECQIYDKNQPDFSPFRRLLFPPVINSDDYSFSSFLQATSLFNMAYGKLTDLEKVKLLHARLAFPYSQFSKLWQAFKKIESGHNTPISYEDYKFHLILFNRYFYAIAAYFNLRIFIENDELKNIPHCSCYFCRDTIYLNVTYNLYTRNFIQKEALERLRELVFAWQTEEQFNNKIYMQYMNRKIQTFKNADKLQRKMTNHIHNHTSYCTYCASTNRYVLGKNKNAIKRRYT